MISFWLHWEVSLLGRRKMHDIGTVYSELFVNNCFRCLTNWFYVLYGTVVQFGAFCDFRLARYNTNDCCNDMKMGMKVWNYETSYLHGWSSNPTSGRSRQGITTENLWSILNLRCNIGACHHEHSVNVCFDGWQALFLMIRYVYSDIFLTQANQLIFVLLEILFKILCIFDRIHLAFLIWNVIISLQVSPTFKWNL